MYKLNLRHGSRGQLVAVRGVPVGELYNIEEKEIVIQHSRKCGAQREVLYKPEEDNDDDERKMVPSNFHKATR